MKIHIIKQQRLLQALKKSPSGMILYDNTEQWYQNNQSTLVLLVIIDFKWEQIIMSIITNAVAERRDNIEISIFTRKCLPAIRCC